MRRLKELQEARKSSRETAPNGINYYLFYSCIFCSFNHADLQCTALYRISIYSMFLIRANFPDTGALLLTGPSSQVLLGSISVSLYMLRQTVENNICSVHSWKFIHACHSLQVLEILVPKLHIVHHIREWMGFCRVMRSRCSIGWNKNLKWHYGFMKFGLLWRNKGKSKWQ